jgi:phage tail sheath protein FI
MPEYLTPGVYMEEISVGPKPIEGVGTSTAGMLGLTERGPEGVRLVTNMGEFERWYGGHLKDSYLPAAVEGFFGNGGARCYIARIVSKEAKKSAAMLEDTDHKSKIYLRAIGPGAWGNNIKVQLSKPDSSSPSDSDSRNKFKMIVAYWMKNAPTEKIQPQPVPQIYDILTPERLTGYKKVLKRNKDEITHEDISLLKVLLPTPKRKEIVGTVEAGDPEFFGELVAETTDSDKAVAAAVIAECQLTKKSEIYKSDVSSEVIIRRKKELTYEDLLILSAILKNDNKSEICGSLTEDKVPSHNEKMSDILNGNSNATQLTAFLNLIGPSLQQRKESLYRKEKCDDPAKLLQTADVLEVFDDLSIYASSPNYFAKVINSQSFLIRITKEPGSDETPNYDFMPKISTEPDFIVPGNGTDGGHVAPENFIGYSNAKAGEKTGLEAFKEIDGINIVYCPDIHWSGITDQLTLQNAIKDHCESMKDRFAILDAPKGQREVNKVTRPVDSKFAAFYYPWIKVYDPLLKDRRLVPPGGFVAGVYARSDIERGVHKAPANEVIRGALELEFPISQEQQAVLNPRGVNVIRQFPDRGIRIWGARTASSDPEWKYINVRRLFLYVDKSIERGTQSITNFLVTVWRDGALMGSTPEQAFFVDIGYSTMTPADLDNGKLICNIGIAPTKPAEFVIFRIFQKTLEVK